jgi:hypothetical protein
VFIIWFVCTTLQKEQNASISKIAQSMWKWCGVRIADTITKMFAPFGVIPKPNQTISVPTEKGERENE